MISDAFVFVSSTNNDITRGLISKEILSKGKQGRHQQQAGDYLITVFPITNYSGVQIGVMAYFYNAAHLFSTLNRTRWGIAVLCSLLLLGIIVPLLFIVRKITVPLNTVITALNTSSDEV